MATTPPRRRRPNPPTPKPGERRALKHGMGAKGPVGNVEQAEHDIAADLAAVAPLRDADGELPGADRAAFELAAMEFAKYRNVGKWIEENGEFTQSGTFRYKLMREHRRLGQHLMVMFHELGLTPQGRAKLGLRLAQTDTVQVAPVRTEERARAVAELLARSGAIPPIDVTDAEVVDPDPEPEPEPADEAPVVPLPTLSISDEELVATDSRLKPVAEVARRSRAKRPPGRARVH